MWLEKDMYKAGWIFAIIFIATGVLLSLFHIKISDITGPCMFHMVTGLYCPGCGGTRALIAFVHCHFIKSLYYHPVVLYGGVVYIVFMVRGTISALTNGRYQCMKYNIIYIYIAIGIIIVQFVAKNVLLIFYGYAWLG